MMKNCRSYVDYMNNRRRSTFLDANFRIQPIDKSLGRAVIHYMYSTEFILKFESLTEFAIEIAEICKREGLNHTINIYMKQFNNLQ